jgi:hypothetical protein
MVDMCFRNRQAYVSQNHSSLETIELKKSFPRFNVSSQYESPFSLAFTPLHSFPPLPNDLPNRLTKPNNLTKHLIPLHHVTQ